MTENNCFVAIREAFLGGLGELNYTKRTMADFGTILNRLEDYLSKSGSVSYSLEAGQAFLRHDDYGGKYSAEYWLAVERVVRRLDCCVRDGSYSLVLLRQKNECPVQFADVFERYSNYLELIGMREGTVKHYQYYCLQALNGFATAGVSEFSEITASHIYELFENTTSKAGLSRSIRNFFKYLFKEGYTGKDLAVFVPSIRRKRPVPSVYTKQEVESFLSAFAKETTLQKRDYAMALLALRLGLRSSDIVKLKFSDIDFQAKKLTFTQDKTLVKQSLELVPDVEDALKSYLSSERQNFDSPYIFLTVKAPIRPVKRPAAYDATRNYLEKAKIEAGERRQGAHALRSTLASELVAEQVPYDVVRKILGHQNPRSTKDYVKFDIRSLRQCAIKVPPLGGKLKEFITEHMGGSYNKS